MPANDNHISSAAFNDELRDLWEYYIQIQEHLLLRRSAPISIKPESIVVSGNKFSALVDESRRDNTVNNIFRNRLALAPEDIANDSICVSEAVWKSLSDTEIDSLRRDLASCYIEMDAHPSINAVLQYGNGADLSANQLTLNEIKTLDKSLRNNPICQGVIDDSVAGIVYVVANPELYFRHLFGDNRYTETVKEKKSGETVIKESVEYQDQYLPEDVLKTLQPATGIWLEYYKIVFEIDNPHAVNVMKYICDYYDYRQKKFVFKRTFDKDDRYTDESLDEINRNIDIFVSEARKHCSADEIRVNTIFHYRLFEPVARKYLLQEAANYAFEHENMSFSFDTGYLGFDFNWRTQSFDDIVSRIESDLPFISIKTHGADHRFKCNISTSFNNVDEIRRRLEERFQNIVISEDSHRHIVDISLPCTDITYYDSLRDYLKRELFGLGLSENFTLDKRIPGKVKVRIQRNDESRVEDLEESLKEMRKVDFGFDIEGKVIPFGRLLTVNYPKLQFDIDVDSNKEVAIRDFLEQKTLSFVVPILSGDIEKISRLKNTFSMATIGSNLLNDNLGNFMFDSSLATKIDDIDLILSRDGGTYKELCRHLLNEKVNESQKDAILKCLYAKDLALIQGPPGSGKSTAIAELIWQLVRVGFKPGNKKERILLTSETNLAVDNAISRIINHKTNLVKPIRFGGEEKLETEGLRFSFDLMKKWVEVGNDALVQEEIDEESGSNSKLSIALNDWLSNISDRAFYGDKSTENDVMFRWRRVLSQPTKSLRESVFKRFVEGCNVIGATCSSIGDTKADGRGMTQFFRNYKEVFYPKGRSVRINFTTVIQDESSKATPAELVLPFVYGERAIVIGDHRQLPPMLDKEEMEESLEYALNISQKQEDKEKIIRLQEFLSTHFKKIEESHFQRLYENIDPSLKETFNLQYRMHPDINEVIKQFYLKDGGLNCGLIKPKDLGVNDPDMGNPASRYHGLDIRPLIGHNTHVLFINTDSPELRDGTSRVNYGEVEVIGKLLDKFGDSSTFNRYLDKFDSEEDKQIGIISFYGKQIKLIRSLARTHNNLPIRVSTVDRFQGMERNIIIVSMVRSNKIQATKGEAPDKRKYGELGYPEQNSLGFAQSPNRLNVALSRAKRLLIIVGNEKLFSRHPIYSLLFQTIRSNPNNKVINQSEL